VSVLPRFVGDSFWSNLLLPQLGALLVVGRNFRRINDPSTGTVFANGAYFLVRKDVYQAAGGLAAVKAVLDEDVAFARRLKAAGVGYHFVEGDGVCSEKMYSTLPEFFAGFGKNVWSTLDRSLLRMLRLSTFVLVVSLTPLIAAVLSGLDAIGVFATSAPSWLLLLGLAQYPLILVLQMGIRRRAGFPAHLALLAPLGGLVVYAILINSAYRGLWKRSVEWKGRSYPA
jgi:hypothetical protein